MNDEAEYEPKTVFCPDCEGRSCIPVDMPGGWNVSHFTECDECTAGEITIEDEESEEWYLKKPQTVRAATRNLTSKTMLLRTECAQPGFTANTGIEWDVVDVPQRHDNAMVIRPPRPAVR